MRAFFSLALLVVGIGSCLLDALASAAARAHSLKLYEQQLDAVPHQQTYTRAQYTAAAWQTWTNRVHLPAKEAYTADELKNRLFGMGASQDSCDRLTLEALIAEAADYSRDRSSTANVFGVLAMLVGAFLLGGVVAPKHARKLQ